MEGRHRLGAMLVEARLLTPEQLKMAMDFQKEVGGKLGAIIVKLGFLEDHTLVDFLARQQGLDVVNLGELVLPENLVRRVPRKLVERHHIIPIAFKGKTLTIATSDPFDYEAIEELQLSLTDVKIEIKLAPRSQIVRCIQEVFSPAGPEESEGEKTKEDLVRELEGDRRPASDHITPLQLREALIPLLVEKGIVSREDLIQKAREMEAARLKETAR